MNRGRAGGLLRRGGGALAALGLCALSSGFSAAPASAEPTAFVKGGGSASADTLGFSIVTSSAKVGLTLGRSIADYRENTGRAEARAVDLGLLPVLFGELSRCDETVALLPKAALPPVTAADSGEPGSDASRRVQVFYPGLNGDASVIPAGFQDATASRQPSSKAATETPTQDISFFGLINPRTEVSTQLVGQLRQAHAMMTADQLTVFGGMIRFEKPRWEAISLSGSSENAVGRFTFDRAFIFEIPRTPEQISSDMGGLDNVLNGLLGGLGVHFDQPKVVVEGRRVKVTPMVFRLTDPPLGTAALLPFFNNIAPYQQMLFDQLVEQDCNNRKAIQLVDVVLQVLKGSGSITIPVGGVEVNTDDKYFPPADAAGPLKTSDTVDEQATTPSSSTPRRSSNPSRSRSSGSTGFSSPLVSSEPTAVEAAVETVAPDTTVVGADAEKSAAPDMALPPALAAKAYQEGSTGGTATALGVLALVGACGLLAADRFRMRNGARRIS